ncbi:MAG: regulatory protein GemA [Rhizobiaceae bacterium]|nr:regulatory protein GemA [Rhizobiaceae bacterium]
MSAIRAIHAGRKQLGIEEDDARDLYAQATGGVRSLRAMTPVQLELVISRMRKMGFKKPSNGAQKGLKGPYAKKLQALWIACWNMGIIHDRKDSALLAFVKRQSGLDHTRFLHHAADANKVIEALKAMLARAGVDWGTDRLMADWAKLEGYRISIAQWNEIHDPNDRDSFEDYLAYCSLHAPDAAFGEMTNHDYIPVMNELGRLIRAKIKAKQ